MKKMLGKRFMFLVVLLVGLCMPTMAQRYYTFNAVALNMDGLPNLNLGVIDVTLNPDGPEAEGTTKIGRTIAMENWDFVALSEDFYYHEELMNGISYNGQAGYDFFGDGENKSFFDGFSIFSGFKTDGLGVLVAKRGEYPKQEGETMVAWTTNAGSVWDGSAGQFDELITKGFRYYCITIAEGISIDVYLLHMDAGSRDTGEDIAAREAQLRQLADAILAKCKTNKRPILIMGDTNCRYTREKLKDGFIDYINSNSDNLLEIKDGWIESVYSGEYPKYGGDALTKDNLGDRMGEVVDKIFYINHAQSNLSIKANSYRLGTEYKLDHDPVIVNFTITDHSQPEPTEEELEDRWTRSEEKIPAVEMLASGKTYFVKNVASGTYLKSGGKNGVQVVEGSAGMPILFTAEGEKFSLKTTLTGTSCYMTSNSDSPMMNGAEGNSRWTVEPIEGTSYYRLLNDANKALAYGANAAGHVVTCVTKNDNADVQQWLLLTENDIRSQMLMATEDKPYDITPLLKAADFDKDNTENNTSNWSGFDACTVGGVADGTPANYNYSLMIPKEKTSTDINIKQAVGNLPLGAYGLSVEGLYNTTLVTTTKVEKRTRRNILSIWGAWNVTESTTTTNPTMDYKVTMNSQSIGFDGNISNISDFTGANAAFRNNDTYKKSLTESLSSGSGTLNIAIFKPGISYQNKVTESGGGSLSTEHTKTTTTYEYSNSAYVDNFKLLYYGNGTDDPNPYWNYELQVIKHLNDTWSKLLELEESCDCPNIALKSFDVSTVIYRLENNMVTTQEHADALCDMIDEAYENAIAAHRAAKMEGVEDGNDITDFIINPSFENSRNNYLVGWTVINNGSVTNRNQTAIVDGDGTKMFEGQETSRVTQTISSLRNGFYELKAQVNTNAGSKVFLIANNYHKGHVANNSGLVDITLYFFVENGQAKISVMGGCGNSNQYYYPEERGTSFKVDHFRLKYICDTPHGRLKMALLDAENAGLDHYGDAVLNLKEYNTTFDNKSLKTDGTSEAAAIYEALRTAAIKQGRKGPNYEDVDPSNMTWAIANPNFETGDYTGWTTTAGWETIVGLQDGRLKSLGADGRYLFNTWNDASEAENSGINASIYQTITGIKNGKYTLKAMVAGGGGNVYLAAKNGGYTETGTDYSTIAAQTTLQEEMHELVLENIEVADNELTIMVSGADANGNFTPTGGCWYKADNFRLEYEGHAVELNQESTSVDDVEDDWYTDVNLKRAMTNMKWHTFVVPFDIPADVIAAKKWDVRELYETTIDETGYHLTLKFRRLNEGEGVEAGVSYMVRYYPDGVPTDDNTTVQETANQSTGDIGIEYVDLDKSTLIDEAGVGVETTVDGSTAVWGNITFAGTYVNETILPDYAFYVSNNKFYLVNPGDEIKTKGYRGYFVQRPNASSNYVRSIGMRSEDATLIESVNNDEVKVVGIYDVNGVRREEMQDGINIVKMSDGSSVKIFINE